MIAPGSGPRGQTERIGEHHAPLGVGVDHLDGRAVLRADHVLRLVRERPDPIFGDRQPAIHGLRRAHRMQGVQASHGHRASLHVDVHVQHAFVRLEVGAAGIEADPFPTRLTAGEAAPRGR